MPLLSPVLMCLATELINPDFLHPNGSETTVIKTSTQRLAWLDTETTGLLASTCVPLEVGVVITDGDLTEIARQRWLVDARGSRTFEALLGGDAYINKMHRENGLLDDLKASAAAGTIRRRFEIDDDLIAFCRQHIPDGKIVLAGSSIHFDKAFLDEHFPAFAAICHHRLVDVSAFQVTLNVINGVDLGTGFEKTGNHRVFADLENSIARARQLWALARSLLEAERRLELLSQCTFTAGFGADQNLQLVRDALTGNVDAVKGKSCQVIREADGRVAEVIPGRKDTL